MTLQEQIEKYRNIAQDAPYSGMAWEIITKQSEMLEVAKDALKTGWRVKSKFNEIKMGFNYEKWEQALAAIEEMEKSCK